MIVRRTKIISFTIEHTSNLIQKLLHANADMHCKRIPRAAGERSESMSVAFTESVLRYSLVSSGAVTII